jgi:hypothetical protein
VYSILLLFVILLLCYNYFFLYSSILYCVCWFYIGVTEYLCYYDLTSKIYEPWRDWFCLVFISRLQFFVDFLFSTPFSLNILRDVLYCRFPYFPHDQMVCYLFCLAYIWMLHSYSQLKIYKTHWTQYEYEKVKDVMDILNITKLCLKQKMSYNWEHFYTCRFNKIIQFIKVQEKSETLLKSKHPYFHLPWHDWNWLPYFLKYLTPLNEQGSSCFNKK